MFFLPVILGFVLLFFGILMIPQIFYLLTLQNTLKLISPGNRRMEPSMVWLQLIPLFGQVWSFFIIDKMADSIQAELGMRGVNVSERPAYNIGLAYAILAACCLIPCVNYLAGIPALICWIIYWIKISEFKTQLQQTPTETIAGDSEIFGY